MLHSLADGGEGVEQWLEPLAPGDICLLSRSRSLLVTTETCDIKRPHRRQCRRSGSSWFAFWFVTSTVSHVQIAPLYFRNIAVCGKQAPYVRCRKYLKWGWNLKLALGEVQLPNAAKIGLRSALSPDGCGQDGQQRGRKEKNALVSVSCEPSMAMKVTRGKRQWGRVLCLPTRLKLMPWDTRLLGEG
jgi:hypothetical protein